MNTSHYGNLPVRSFMFAPQGINNNGGNNGGDFGDNSMGRPSPQLQTSSLMHNHHQSSMSAMSNSHRNDNGEMEPIPISNNTSAYLPMNMNPNNKHFHPASSNSLINEDGETNSPNHSNHNFNPVSAGASSPGINRFEQFGFR